MRASVRPTPIPVLLLVPCLVALVACWFHSPWFPMATLAGLEQASGGWLSVTLLGSGVLGLAELLLLLGPGRQRFADIGWRGRDLLPAAWVTLLLWIAMQASIVLAARAAGQPLQWHPAWAAGAGIALGPLLAQLLGTALFEETVMRAWLWPQLAERWSALRPRWLGPVLALLASQAIFALLHLPSRLYAGADAGAVLSTMAMLFVVGIVFVLVYAATRNLFVAVGAHALGNAPTLLFEPQGPAPSLVMLGGLVVACLVLYARRRARTPDLRTMRGRAACR